MLGGGQLDRVLVVVEADDVLQQEHLAQDHLVGQVSHVGQVLWPWPDLQATPELAVSRDVHFVSIVAERKMEEAEVFLHRRVQTLTRSRLRSETLFSLAHEHTVADQRHIVRELSPNCGR